MYHSDPAVAHALQIRRAVQLDNYHQYFILRRSTPHLGNCILDLMIDARRLHALQRICRGYKPTVPVDFVLAALDIGTRRPYYVLETPYYLLPFATID